MIPPSESLAHAILSCEHRDWSSLFEIFRQQQYTKLRSAETETERLQIQQSVKAFDLIEDVFKRIREDKKIVLDIQPKK